MMRKLKAALCAALLAASASAHVRLPYSTPSTLTTTAQWTASAFSAIGAGAALPAALYAGTPIFQDSFNVSGCPTIGFENFQTDANGFHQWWSVGAGSSASPMGGLAGGKFIDITGKWGTNPFDCSTGVLTIALSYNSGLGYWQGGEIASHNYDGNGFSFSFGYAEATIKFPASTPVGLQPWPSFWSVGRFVTSPIPNAYQEFDMFEAGLVNGSPTTLDVTIHQDPATTPPPGEITTPRSKQTTTTINIYDGAYHRYGLLRTPTFEALYIDRLLVTKWPVYSDDLRKPMYILLDNAVYFIPTDTTQTMTMSISNVSVWACPVTMPICQ